jgi:hypothetical protein
VRWQVLFGESWNRVAGSDDLNDDHAEDVTVLSVLLGFPLACMLLVALAAIRETRSWRPAWPIIEPSDRRTPAPTAL